MSEGPDCSGCYEDEDEEDGDIYLDLD